MLRKVMTALSMAACLALTAFAVRAQDMPRASARVEGLLARMTIEEKIGQLVQMPGGRQRELRTAGSTTRSAPASAPAGSAPISTSPAPRRPRALQRIAVEETRLHIPLLFGDGRDPRLPHDLPGAAGDGVELGPGRARARRAHRRHRGPRRRPALDLLADGRHRPRSALGPDRRGRGRGPLSRRAHGRGPGARLSGRRPRRPDTIMAAAKHFAAYGAARAGAITPAPTCRERSLAKSTCRPSRRRRARARRSS